MVNKRQSTLSLLTELIETSIKQNYNERIKDQQRAIELLQGNYDELLKRFNALIKYVGAEYVLEAKYKRKK